MRLWDWVSINFCNGNMLPGAPTSLHRKQRLILNAEIPSTAQISIYYIAQYCRFFIYVICVNASGELTWKSLQHQDQEQWTQDTAMMHNNSNTKLLNWSLTCTRLQALQYMPWITRTAHSLSPRLLKAQKIWE